MSTNEVWSKWQSISRANVLPEMTSRGVEMSRGINQTHIMSQWRSVFVRTIHLDYSHTHVHIQYATFSVLQRARAICYPFICFLQLTKSINDTKFRLDDSSFNHFAVVSSECMNDALQLRSDNINTCIWLHLFVPTEIHLPLSAVDRNVQKMNTCIFRTLHAQELEIRLTDTYYTAYCIFKTNA